MTRVGNFGKSGFGNKVIREIDVTPISLPIRALSRDVECSLCGTITGDYVVRDGLTLCNHCAGNYNKGDSFNNFRTSQ
jgi:hypothetical protein